MGVISFDLITLYRQILQSVKHDMGQDNLYLFIQCTTCTKPSEFITKTTIFFRVIAPFSRFFLFYWRYYTFLCYILIFFLPLITLFALFSLLIHVTTPFLRIITSFLSITPHVLNRVITPLFLYSWSYKAFVYMFWQKMPLSWKNYQVYMLLRIKFAYFYISV